MNLITLLGVGLVLMAIGVYAWSRPIDPHAIKPMSPWIAFTRNGAIVVAILFVFAMIVQSYSAYQQGYDDGYDKGHALGGRQANQLAQCAEDDYWYPANFEPVNQASDLVCKNIDEKVDTQTARVVVMTLYGTGLLTQDEADEYLNSLTVDP